MTMPRMSGSEALTALRALRPAIPVVFISGYSVVAEGAAFGDPLTAFLHKPFKPPMLASRIREVLTAGPPLTRR